jgi:photosystem II stability/assembly factor-like uncharacterized protein
MKTWRVHLLTLVLLAFATTAPIIAATPAVAAPHWVQASLFGGSISALAEAPSSPQTLYAAVLFGGFYASLDGGATWRPRQGFAPGVVIQELLVDHHDRRTVYARTESTELLRTRDGGRHWSQITPDSHSVLGLALDGGNPDGSDILYAATVAGLYRSADAGTTWTLAAFEGSRLLAVAIDPRDPATFFVAIGPPEGVGLPLLWKSSDHGASWAETPPLGASPSSTTSTPRFVFDPAHPGTVYIFFIASFNTAVPLFRSTDGGASWVELPAVIDVHDLVALADGTLLAATDFGIARSVDHGETWSPPLPTTAATLAPPDDTVADLLVSSAPRVLFAAGSAGVWKSIDSATSWQLSSHGIVALGVFSLIAAPVGPDTVIAVAGNSVYRSGDQGDSWARVHSEVQGPQPFTIEALDPRRPRTMYGIGFDGQADRVLKSTNGGRAWSVKPIPYTCGGSSACSVTITAFTLDPDHPDTVFVAGSYFFHLAGSGDFLLRSDDGGATWRNLPALHDLQALAVAPRRNGALYGLTCGGLFKRQGSTTAAWRRAGRGLPAPACSEIGKNLVIDPRQPQRVWVGTGGHGVFASSDGGETFQAMNRGLETAAIATLLIDPTDSAKLYAAVPTRGVFRWNAVTRRWTPLSSGLPVAHFEGVLALDPQDPSILYAGTSDQGVFRLDLDE